MNTFTIKPILGRKNDVPPDDPTMFQFVAESVALTHDFAGKNYSLKRKKNTCIKSLGKAQQSGTVIPSETFCMGLFELYDGTNRNYINFDHGKVYSYNSSWAPVELAAEVAVTFATDSTDLYSVIRVGDYMVFADRAEHTPYKWKHGDAYLTKLCASGTEYKFRYLTSFQRRVIGLYSDQTDGDIDVRWSTAWPATVITSLNFAATNQLYIPNDDSITGVGLLGRDRCFIFCENSIQQMVYYQDFSTPFRIFTMVSDQGGASHHSIVEANGQLYLFNKNFGFCSYSGGNTISPVSDDILTDLQAINPTYHPLIVGRHIPYRKQIHWAVPLDGESSCNHIVIYNYDTGQWEIEDKSVRWIDSWFLYSSMTWTELETAVGGTGLWSDAGSALWGSYFDPRTTPMYGASDGHVYKNTTEANAGADLDGYRVEPVLSFGNPRRFDTILEIWFGLGNTGEFNIDVHHRSGDTVGELVSNSFESLGMVSCNSPYSAKLPVNKNARLHQIKWGTDNKDQKFEVNEIVFKYNTGSEV